MKTSKIILWVVIGLIAIYLLYQFVKRMNNSKTITTIGGTNSSTSTSTGGGMPNNIVVSKTMAGGGTTGSSTSTGGHTGGGGHGGGGYYNGNFPNFNTVNVIPYVYNQCPDWSSKPVQNISFGGASNLYFSNVGIVGNCPSCIIYNGVTYYYNGSDINGCYYQANYNYILPQFITYNNRGHRGGHGGHGHGGGH